MKSIQRAALLALVLVLAVLNFVAIVPTSDAVARDPYGWVDPGIMSFPEANCSICVPVGSCVCPG